MRSFFRKIFPRLFFRLFYLGTPPWDSGITPPELEEFIESHPPGRAIDLGCGTGTNAITLAQHGWQVRGVDFVPKAVRQGRRKTRQAGVEVELLVGDVTLPEIFTGPYDLILDIGCYHALNEGQRKAYRENIGRYLAADGMFLLYSFTSDDPQDLRFTSKDQAAFEKLLTLERREDSLDPGGPSSAWMWFRKPVM